jgi:hypothetical protein
MAGILTGGAPLTHRSRLLSWTEERSRACATCLGWGARDEDGGGERWWRRCSLLFPPQVWRDSVVCASVSQVTNAGARGSPPHKILLGSRELGLEFAEKDGCFFPYRTSFGSALGRVSRFLVNSSKQINSGRNNSLNSVLAHLQDSIPFGNPVEEIFRLL